MNVSNINVGITIDMSNINIGVSVMYANIQNLPLVTSY